jgi:hypothetical protein
VKLQSITIKPDVLVAIKPLQRYYKVKSKLMQSTVCSESRKIKPIVAEERISLPKELKFRYKGKVLLPTLSHRKKRREKCKSEMSVNKWNLCPQVEYEYVSSILNNNAAIPEPQRYTRTPSPPFLNRIFQSPMQKLSAKPQYKLSPLNFDSILQCLTSDSPF